jgi:hypothetical protein
MTGAEEGVVGHDGEAHGVLPRVSDAAHGRVALRRAKEPGVRRDEQRPVGGIHSEPVDVAVLVRNRRG